MLQALPGGSPGKTINEKMELTYYGHSCIGVELGDVSLLFDPFISDNPLAAGIDLEKIPATHVLLTHGHGDHIGDAEAILKRTGALLISNFEICEWFAGKGVKHVHGMNIGGQLDLDGFSVKCTVAHHSSTLPDGASGGMPMGFVIRSAAGNFHHAGDTALTLDMQLLKRHQLAFACLPIGDNFTMGVDDAVEAAQYMGVSTVLGLHYDTFPPIAIDRAAATAAFSKAGIRLLLPAIGTTVEL